MFDKKFTIKQVRYRISWHVGGWEIYQWAWSGSYEALHGPRICFSRPIASLEKIAERLAPAHGRVIIFVELVTGDVGATFQMGRHRYMHLWLPNGSPAVFVPVGGGKFLAMENQQGPPKTLDQWIAEQGPWSGKRVLIIADLAEEQ